jgi:hypothetical protein
MPSKDVLSWRNDLEVNNIFTNFHFNLFITVRKLDTSTHVRTNVNNTISDQLREFAYKYPEFDIQAPSNSSGVFLRLSDL